MGLKLHKSKHALLKLPRFEDYRSHLIDHLIQISIRHWDKQMRVLASQTLGKLVSIDPEIFLNKVLPRLVSIMLFICVSMYVKLITLADPGCNVNRPKYIAWCTSKCR